MLVSNIRLQSKLITMTLITLGNNIKDISIVIFQLRYIFAQIVLLLLES